MNPMAAAPVSCDMNRKTIPALLTFMLLSQHFFVPRPAAQIPLPSLFPTILPLSPAPSPSAGPTPGARSSPSPAPSSSSSSSSSSVSSQSSSSSSPVAPTPLPSPSPSPTPTPAPARFPLSTFFNSPLPAYSYPYESDIGPRAAVAITAIAIVFILAGLAILAGKEITSSRTNS